MSRITKLNQRYAASASLVRTGVEIVAVGDPAGARLNAAVRRLMVASNDDGPELWENLIGSAKSLRWRLVTLPLPSASNHALITARDELLKQVRRLRGAIGDEGLLDDLQEAGIGVTAADPALGNVLLRSIEEVGAGNCVVVAASRVTEMSLSNWLESYGVRVMTARGLEREQPEVEQAYVVGPPRFYKSSLVTAPVTPGLSFLLPAWFWDRTIPRSAIAPYSEGAIRIQARVFTEGDTTEPQLDAAAEDVEDEFLPQPSWGPARSADREPGPDEVEARKVLLSGNLAIWLDDGDRIRALDPDQPAGERVVYTEVRAVRPGTYLVLRQGESERGALSRAALARLSSKGPAVDSAQKAWKSALRRRIQEFTYRRTVSELRARGVKTADRARAWTEPSLVRPNRDEDFERLLEWLAIPVQPTFGYATMLRRAHHQASADLREQLERTVSEADLSALEREGHWLLHSTSEGIRGMVASRVLAVSPHKEVIPRHDARVPFEDWSGQWLE